MRKCKKCRKILSNNKGTTRLCITCFNEARTGDKNPAWSDSSSHYGALHKWIRQRFPRPQLCNDCSHGFPIDLANISQEYKRDLSDWEWLCRRCHMLKDGRIKKLKTLFVKGIEDTTKVNPILLRERIINRNFRKSKKQRGA